MNALAAGAAPQGEGDGGTRGLEIRRFATLADYTAATRQDQHSVLLDYDVFVNVPRLDAKDLKAVQRLYKAENLDFRLKPASAAVDRGVPLPNVTMASPDRRGSRRARSGPSCCRRYVEGRSSGRRADGTGIVFHGRGVAAPAARGCYRWLRVHRFGTNDRRHDCIVRLDAVVVTAWWHARRGCTVDARSSTTEALASSPAPAFREVVVPTGTTLRIRLMTNVSSTDSHVEDKSAGHNRESSRRPGFDSDSRRSRRVRDPC